MGSLTGRTALVTGGSRNLGASIVEELARAGASVAINYHGSREAAEELAAALEHETGVAQVAVPGDVATEAGIRGLVAAAADGLGRPVDILVNNAGPYLATSFAELATRDWQRMIDTNLRAVYLAARSVAADMRRSGWGRIVNVSAVSAYVRDRSIYGLVKHAVNVLTEELALELGPEITVNAVAPGQIAESVPDLREVAPAWAEQVVRRTPLQRLVTRQEIGAVVVRLCEPLFDGVTGATIPIDGGLRLNRLG